MPLPIYQKELHDRPHVSFSEAYTFYKCHYNHWLNYRERKPREDTIYTIFGKSVGHALERYKKNNVKNSWISIGKDIVYFLADNGEWSEYVKEEDRDWRKWSRSGFRVFKETLEFLDKNYPNWELIDFEYELFEPIDGSTKKFKGYIDIIFKWNGKIYIFDFKTCSWGWDKEKRQNTQKLYQVILYKYFYCLKHNIDPNLVECGYLLLKRTPAKSDKTSVELFEQSSGKVKLNNSIEWLKEQAVGIDAGMNLKLKDTCEFCSCGAAPKKFFRRSK